MQIRCYHCHKPFALGKEAIHAALDEISEQDLNHYNAYCPHCRRANRLSPEELKRAAPEWQKSDSQEVQSG
jgi:phage FluMu protein Com